MVLGIQVLVFMLFFLSYILILVNITMKYKERVLRVQMEKVVEPE